MIDFLKKRNRTLLELWTGILLLGIVAQVAGAVLVNIFFETEGQLRFALSLWVGVAMSLLSSIHMYKSLDKALDFEEKIARKKIYLSYFTRYAVIVILFVAVCITNILNPLVMFIGYMMLKFGAFLQPQMHKLYNKLFNETDPIPVTEEEAIAAREAASDDYNTGKEVKL